MLLLILLSASCALLLRALPLSSRLHHLLGVIAGVYLLVFVTRGGAAFFVGIVLVSWVFARVGVSAGIRWWFGALFIVILVLLTVSVLFVSFGPAHVVQSAYFMAPIMFVFSQRIVCCAFDGSYLVPSSCKVPSNNLRRRALVLPILQALGLPEGRCSAALPDERGVHRCDAAAVRGVSPDVPPPQCSAVGSFPASTPPSWYLSRLETPAHAHRLRHSVRFLNSAFQEMPSLLEW